MLSSHALPITSKHNPKLEVRDCRNIKFEGWKVLKESFSPTHI